MQVLRSSTCSSCSKDLKICYNCKFFSEGVHWDCLETIQEPVNEKDRSNFCDFFQFKESENKRPSLSQKEKAKENFNKLFGNGF